MYLVINKWVTAVKVSNFSGHYLRKRSTLDIGVLGYIGVVQHKEHSPEVLSILPGTLCIVMFLKSFLPEFLRNVFFCLSQPSLNVVFSLSCVCLYTDALYAHQMFLEGVHLQINYLSWKRSNWRVIQDRTSRITCYENIVFKHKSVLEKCTQRNFSTLLRRAWRVALPPLRVLCQEANTNS